MNKGTQKADKDSSFAKACKHLRDNWKDESHRFTTDNYKTEFEKLQRSFDKKSYLERWSLLQK
ncbi:MAG: hypothetical protein HRU26_14910 [Psychroserpens sp.]|nr:hypothetical protein [Psychroserpens sp.]